MRDIESISQIISQCTGFKTEIVVNPENYSVTAWLKVEFEVGGFPAKTLDNFAEKIKAMPVNESIRCAHDSETKKLRIKIEKLEKQVSELAPYKHFAEVSKEIAGIK